MQIFRFQGFYHQALPPSHSPFILSLPSPTSSLTFLCMLFGRITCTQESIQYNANKRVLLSGFSQSKHTCVTSIQIRMQNSSSTSKYLSDPFPSQLPPEKVTIILISKTRGYLAFLKTLRKWNIQNLGFCACFLVFTVVSLRLTGGMVWSCVSIPYLFILPAVGGHLHCPQFGGHHEESGTVLYVAFGEQRSWFGWVCTQGWNCWVTGCVWSALADTVNSLHAGCVYWLHFNGESVEGQSVDTPHPIPSLYCHCGFLPSSLCLPLQYPGM